MRWHRKKALGPQRIVLSLKKGEKRRDTKKFALCVCLNVGRVFGHGESILLFGQEIMNTQLYKAGEEKKYELVWIIPTEKN